MTSDERIKVLEDRMNTIYEVLTEATATGRNAYSIHNRMMQWEDTFNNFNKTLDELTQNIQSLMIDARFVELFSTEEIHNWYMATDLTTKNVQELLAIHFPDKKDITLETVGNYVHGRIPDVHIRSFLGKHLRNEANKKSAKDRKESANAKPALKS